MVIVLKSALEVEVRVLKVVLFQGGKCELRPFPCQNALQQLIYIFFGYFTIWHFDSSTEFIPRIGDHRSATLNVKEFRSTTDREWLDNQEHLNDRPRTLTLYYFAFYTEAESFP